MMNFPFECENCGHKPTPQEVIANHGDCAKCGDTVIAYTMDTAELILSLSARPYHAAYMRKQREQDRRGWE